MVVQQHWRLYDHVASPLVRDLVDLRGSGSLAHSCIGLSALGVLYAPFRTLVMAILVSLCMCKLTTLCSSSRRQLEQSPVLSVHL